MDVWQFISGKLAHNDVMLLYVLDSQGSSPGRQGFKMAVASDGSFFGTIGGGIMEHKLVEKAKMMLQQKVNVVSLMWQYHDKEHTKDRSGMICSGNQLNAFIPLTIDDKKNVAEIIKAAKETLQISGNGISVNDDRANGLRYTSDDEWNYSETLQAQPIIHIIGGGHVALALSEIMHFLGFYIKLYDDRPELNTIAANAFADEKYIIDYNTIASSINNVANDYIVIMTIGYRTDKIVLKQLIDQPFLYLGLLGSQHKIDILFAELKEEGIAHELITKVFSPIGLAIASRTTQEIAVSIAAQIIQQKNK